MPYVMIDTETKIRTLEVLQQRKAEIEAAIERLEEDNGVMLLSPASEPDF
jgi:hypothetical protein